MTTHSASHWILIALAGLSATAVAEIREIPPEEMTEAYIRDTTVIIRKQEASEESSNAKVKVKPLKEGYSEGSQLESDMAASNGQSAGDSHQSEMISNDLAAQSSYSYQATDPTQALREAYLRDVLGMAPGTPIDYNNLSFPTGISTDVTPPSGISSAISPNQFSISIPNTGNYSSESYGTPNGEYQVNITPSEITFTVNLPQR